MSNPLIDVNVNLGQWPTRRVTGDTIQELTAKLIGHGVGEAWVGSFDGLFHKDLAGVNTRLAKECRTQTKIRLVPFGEINPMLPNWEAELRVCVEKHHMPGIRLHPNYHGYSLDHPDFGRLLQAAAKHGVVVALAHVMEDERMMHPLLRVPAVNLAPLEKLLKQIVGLRVVLLNATKTELLGDSLDRLLQAGEVDVEIAMLEGVGGVANLLQDVPLERVLFGSHSPSFYFESAALKLQESQLAEFQLRAISHENARRLVSND